MKTKLVLFAAYIGGIAATVAGAESGQRWHHDFDAAIRDADAAGLPLLLHFHAKWCGPCQRMEGSVLNRPEVLQQLGQVFIGAKIDVDEQPAVAERFGVSTYPFDVLLAPDGEVLLRVGGYAQLDDYIDRIRIAAARVAPSATIASGRRARGASVPGLNGYSPVSIVNDHQWRKGSPEIAFERDKVVYYFVDANELELFQANPARYAPQLGGRDAISLALENREQPGTIHYAAFYRERLYLFTSSHNRLRFMESPDQYYNLQRKPIGNRQPDRDAELASGTEQ